MKNIIGLIISFILSFIRNIFKLGVIKYKSWRKFLENIREG
jgi:hypothetical protein